jgi:hypothetical protein
MPASLPLPLPRQSSFVAKRGLEPDVESRNGGYVISFDPPFRSIVVVVSTKDL